MLVNFFLFENKIKMFIMTGEDRIYEAGVWRLGNVPVPGCESFYLFYAAQNIHFSLKTEIKLIKANDFVIKFVPWHFNQILFILKV